ncbi:trypsin, alkaline C-like [Spodoptera litura]|uniref:Trypsin, alkaline C-like n=1 Tax=Spodoptera litura TaxID=69820 RepID=A0A9J7E3Q1_SPOLT|nr:trypsin, alkaline C-like [Spodoptera litura]
MRIIILAAFCVATVVAVPKLTHQRIVGGDVTTIDQYPSIVALLFVYEWVIYAQECAGAILNSRSVLTAAHCTYFDAVSKWRVRAGSTTANAGGSIHRVSGNIIHPLNGVEPTMDHDIAVLRVATPFEFNEFIQPARIAGPNYRVPDYDYLWAAGWGTTYYGATSGSAQLRHVQVLKINLDRCKQQYDVVHMVITDYMLCSGWLTGGRDQCQGDSGGPIYHNGVVVGVCSFGIECGRADFPGVNTRVANYSNWVVDNA